MVLGLSAVRTGEAECRDPGAAATTALELWQPRLPLWQRLPGTQLWNRVRGNVHQLGVRLLLH